MFGTLHAVLTNVLCMPRENYGRGLWPRKVDLSLPVIILLMFQDGASAVVYYVCHFVSLHVCTGDFVFWVAFRPFLGKETISLASCF